MTTIDDVCEARIAMNDKKLGAWADYKGDLHLDIVEEALDQINYASKGLETADGYDPFDRARPIAFRLARYNATDLIKLIVAFDPTVLDRALERAKKQKEYNDAVAPRDIVAEKCETIKSLFAQLNSASDLEAMQCDRIADLEKQLAAERKKWARVRERLNKRKNALHGTPGNDYERANELERVFAILDKKCWDCGKETNK